MEGEVKEEQTRPPSTPGCGIAGTASAATSASSLRVAPSRLPKARPPESQQSSSSHPSTSVTPQATQEEKAGGDTDDWSSYTPPSVNTGEEAYRRRLQQTRQGASIITSPPKAYGRAAAATQQTSSAATSPIRTPSAPGSSAWTTAPAPLARGKDDAVHPSVSEAVSSVAFTHGGDGASEEDNKEESELKQDTVGGYGNDDEWANYQPSTAANDAYQRRMAMSSMGGQSSPSLSKEVATPKPQPSPVPQNSPQTRSTLPSKKKGKSASQASAPAGPPIKPTAVTTNGGKSGSKNKGTGSCAGSKSNGATIQQPTEAANKGSVVTAFHSPDTHQASSLLHINISPVDPAVEPPAPLQQRETTLIDLSFEAPSGPLTFPAEASSRLLPRSDDFLELQGLNLTFPNIGGRDADSGSVGPAIPTTSNMGAALNVAGGQVEASLHTDFEQMSLGPPYSLITICCEAWISRTVPAHHSAGAVSHACNWSSCTACSGTSVPIVDIPGRGGLPTCGV